MKILLTLLLTSILTFGQTEENLSKIFDIPICVSTTTIDTINRVEEALLNLLEAYQEECYADSTENEYFISYTINYDVTTGNLFAEPVKYYFNNTAYIHREPTFIGFIEFLRNRENKK